jgi:RES domain-containing protein
LQFFRIFHESFLPLDGLGSFYNGGRWTSPGRRAIYCGTNVSVCKVEIESYLLTHLPKVYKIVVLSADDPSLLTKLNLTDLPKNWDSIDTRGIYSITRPFGDEWLTSRRSLLLRVPSAVSPLDYNIIINPEHADFPKLSKLATLSISWDDASKSKLFE